MSHPLIGMTCGISGAQSGRSASQGHAVPAPYVDAILRAGGAPILIPARDDPKSLDRIFEIIDGLLLPGGGDIAPSYFDQEPHPALGAIDPERDATEVGLLGRALASEEPMPVLAICRGIQVLNVAAGGSLIQDIPAQVPNALQHRQSSTGPVVTHTLYLASDAGLREILGTDEIRTNTHHHQAVDRVADGFRVSARSADGIVEGIEKPDARFISGIQCHPERLAVKYPLFQRLFDAFVAASDR